MASRGKGKSHGKGKKKSRSGSRKGSCRKSAGKNPPNDWVQFLCAYAKSHNIGYHIALEHASKGSATRSKVMKAWEDWKDNKPLA